MTDRGDIAWLLEFEIEPADEKELAQVLTELVDATKKEDGAIVYEAWTSEDKGVLHIYEHYTSSNAAMHHLQSLDQQAVARLLALVKPQRCVLYGVPNDDVAGALNAFSPVIMRRVAGFARSGQDGDASSTR